MVSSRRISLRRGTGFECELFTDRISLSFFSAAVSLIRRQNNNANNRGGGNNNGGNNRGGGGRGGINNNDGFDPDPQKSLCLVGNQVSEGAKQDGQAVQEPSELNLSFSLHVGRKWLILLPSFVAVEPSQIKSLPLRVSTTLSTFV